MRTLLAFLFCSFCAVSNGQGDHAHDGAGHAHALTEPGHVHAHTEPGHSHAHTEPGHSHGLADPLFGHALEDSANFDHDSHAGHDHDSHAGHGHDSAPRYFDWIRPYESHGVHGHTGHISVEGYPFVHGIRTEIDFVERALELDLVHTRGADGGLVDEWEFESELVWALNSRAIFILGIPLIALDPAGADETAGYGDLEVGFQFLAFGGRRDLLFVALNIGVPTGDADRDLGTGRTVLEPTVLHLHDFGGGTYVQSRFALEVPVSTGDVANDFGYDIALFHTFVSTEDWTCLRYFTPIVEFNGVTALNGAESSRTVVDLTSGVRWVVRELDEVGIGWSFPLTGTEDFDWQMLLSYRLHF